MTHINFTPKNTVQNPFWSLFRDEPRFTGMALLLAAFLVPSLMAMALDARLFQGDNTWLKPIKFLFALIVYLATLAYYARFLPEGMTQRRAYRVFSNIVLICILLELIWIVGAASFATASHYNDTSPIMIAIYAVMGFLATILTAASLVYGIAIWRDPNSRLPPPMRHALSLSLILTFVLTMITASTLANGTGHFVGTPTSGASLPVMGWSGEVGDKRIGHFFATHAMHFIPLAALILPASIALSWSIALGYTALTLAVFAQALMGLPLIAL